MSGYARIHRSLLGHPAFRNDAEAMSFAWLVIRAQWRDVRVRYKDRMISLRRGQVAVSVRDFAMAMDRDKAWIERLLKRLKIETMLETDSQVGVLVITICNYDEYQGAPDVTSPVGETPPETRNETPNETGLRQSQDTEQRREKRKKEPNGSSLFAREPVAAFQLPPDIPADEWRDFEEMRCLIRKPMTDSMRAKAIARLRKLAEDGYPPGIVLSHSTLNSYQGLFPPKDGQNGNSTAGSGAGVNGTRGTRPNPAFDLVRAADRAASGAAGDWEAGGGALLALPPHGPN